MCVIQMNIIIHMSNLEATMSYAFRISKIHTKPLLSHNPWFYQDSSIFLDSNAKFYYHSGLNNGVTTKKYSK